MLVWYDRDHPLDTFKYQEYDLRNHEFTPAVESWVRMMRSDYPRYVVIVRDVDPKREPGNTEKLKVGSVIKRELAIAAAMAGIGIGVPTCPQSILFGSATITQPRQAATTSITSDRSFLAPSSSTFPVPIPYPRPHP